LASWQAHLISAILRHTFKPRLARAATIADARKVMHGGPRFRVPATVRITSAQLGQTGGEWVEPVNGNPDTILFFLHGGGYFACSPKSHRPYTTAFAERGFRIYAPSYRLAPEHKFPAGLDDALSAYHALRIQYPNAPVVIAGDSAGGGLALATMLRLRDRGDPLPQAAVLFSPLTDMTGTGASRFSNSSRCAMFFEHTLPKVHQYYLDDRTDPGHPLVSPLFAKLAGLPPMLIHVGADETLLDDSVRFAEKAREAGVRVELDIWPVVPHDWQLAHNLIPEGRQSLNAAAAFLRRETVASTTATFDTIIAGAGFAGLGMAIQLRKAGRESFLILEKAADIGGTWRENTYPGCACDIPSHLYSFSFELNPNWTRMYPSQREIWQYMQDVVDKHHLRPSIRLHSELVEAVFDETECLWRVRLRNGEQLRARFLVAATGPLSKPAIPDIAGLERFEGCVFHSACWDHSYDLQDKRVAVIGTGASAIQFVPEIAPKVKQLYVFQRTAPWIVPRMDRPIRGIEKCLFRHVPGYMRLFRALLFFRNELLVPGFAGNTRWLAKPTRMALDLMSQQVPDETMRKRLTPNYHIGCKRVLISNDYYPALVRPNVELVTDAIGEVNATGVVTRDGTQRDVDAIILGTGFRVTDFLAPVRIAGRGGVELTETWRRQGARAYYGITVSGFPNLFILVGPNTGLGHNSIIFMIESQVRYVMDCMRKLEARGARALDVRLEVQDRFNEHIHARLKKAVWSAGGCKSWYLDEHGRNPTLWPGSTIPYWRQTHSARPSDYMFIE
jgi:cation diffusion facilitator CzcD-associated flavoprotein CzcO/acetyl esterase/lipase